MTWKCHACTFANENDEFLACSACGSERDTALSEFTRFESSPEPAPVAPLPRRPTRAAPKLVPPSSPIHESSSGSNKGDPLKPLYQELVETERIYVKELQAVVMVFLLPLKARAQESKDAYLTESEVNSIFGNIAEMSRVNQELLAEFDKALQTVPESDSLKRIEALCSCFLRYASHLKMYAIYAIQYDEAQNKLKRYEAERYRFADFLNSAGGMNEVIMNQPLASFLIKPIQRICKYPLFFHSMMKLIKEDSAVYPLLKRTLEAASDVASKINADKLRAEQNLRAFEVAKRLENLADVVLEPGRRFLGEWKCLISEGHNSMSQKRRSMANKMIASTEKKVRSFFLFNDVLLVTKEVGTGNKLRYELRLWMSMDQLQFGGITSAAPGGDAPNQQPRSRDPSGDPGNGEEGAFRPKLFQLPLDILHVASTDRERCMAYRERQQQGKEAQGTIQQITSRRPSLFKKKGQHSTASPAETVITAYTMWFRSGAERARVCNLIEKTMSEFAERSLSRLKAGTNQNDLILPPMSPAKRSSTGVSAPETAPNAEGGRFFASSEDSAQDESPRAGDAPTNSILKSQSFDSGLSAHGISIVSSSTYRGGLVPPPPQQQEQQRVPSRAGASSLPPTVTYTLDPLHEAPKQPGSSSTTSSGNPNAPGPAQPPVRMTPRRSSNRPRPPPPPPPSALMSPPGVTATIKSTPIVPHVPAPKPVVVEDLLISKWFGE